MEIQQHLNHNIMSKSITNTYVKKAVQIEAAQLTRTNIEEVAAWANSIQPAYKQVILSYNEGEPKLIVPTKEGNMICSIGDYLIKESFPTDNRMFYPCKPDMFALTYTKAAPSSATLEAIAAILLKHEIPFSYDPDLLTVPENDLLPTAFTASYDVHYGTLSLKDVNNETFTVAELMEFFD